MDRFIVFFYLFMSKVRFNLKSNMDRFIGGYELREDYTYFDLKSNMDRFIELQAYPTVEP